MGFFDKIRQGLERTKQNFGNSLNGIFATFRKVDEDFLEELMDILICADVSVESAEKIIASLRECAKLGKISDAQSLKSELINIISAQMHSDDIPLNLSTKPSIILVIGVNGVGKTTSVAKIASNLKKEGKKVIIAAADTFRAAAADQLQIWAERINVDIVRHNEGSDPAAVVFDAISAGKARGCDVIICDTAGRLHNKSHLMEELAKINRIIDRELPDSSKEILLVLDATTGQNALSQAKEFKKYTGISGVVLTKLDGTAKGGMVVSVKDELSVPVKLIGVGEKEDDLQVFSPDDFAKALLE